MQPADSCFESHPQILKAPLMSTPPAHVPALPPTSSTCSSNEPIPSCTSLEAYPPPERPVVPPPTRHAPQTVSPLSGVSTDEGEPSMTVETVLEHWGPGPQTQQAPPPAAAGAGPAHHQQQQEFLFPRGAGLWGSAAAAAPCGVWGNTATMVVTEARDSESVDPFLA
uniref:Uncharacterized protein n=1 Tax=Chromera velia CCMP2878 TaxID=1169474 RepID=A0A0G4GPK5_9ALVE|eukprot:Cvel_22781.t1-p1 / transcript=Cvel_22781.t1 / gene=Cvel_22781 / organism=Chromera_velia_CCMP2878 / gene_product=hypothetical protein / transcript_product=hypothetical protein / location=Cvel_scaffold2278:40-537(+) / protein_length=166 / sequence_SO=supercontig / SO=protein_coding / is_pseudo=false